MVYVVRVTAPAKVNIALRVGEKRPDGFHPLDTVFEALDLFDEITATGADDLSLVMEGGGAESLPVDGSNLALRAAQALRACSGKDMGAALHIRKRIPIAGGMAGGSADAAGTLVALNELWGLGMNREDLLPVAASLGSDVPFCLLGGMARGRGRGEQLESLVPSTFHSWVFLTNPRGMSTPDVFREFDVLRASLKSSVAVGQKEEAAVQKATEPKAAGQELVEQKGTVAPNTFSVEPYQAEESRHNKVLAAEGAVPASLNQLVEALQAEGNDPNAYMLNDLTEAALSLRPDLREVMEKMRPYGTVILSGSGPTIAVLVSDSLQADAVAGRAQKMFPHLGVVRANGPAAGAHVVYAGEETPRNISSQKEN